MTEIGGMPLGAGKGVLHGVTGVFKKEVDFFRKTEGQSVPQVPDLPAGSSHAPPLSVVTAPDHSAETGNGETSALKVTVLGAKDLGASDIKPYVVLRLGAVEHKTKHAAKSAAPEWYIMCSWNTSGI